MLPSIDLMLIGSEASLRQALEVIDRNAQGVCFVVNDHGCLVGILTDGDIRRSILKGAQLDVLVAQVMRSEFVTLPIDVRPEVIQETLSSRIKHIPLIDSAKRPVDYACIHRIRRFQVSEPSLTGNELAYVTDCIKTNWISSQGTYVRKFEQQFVDFIGVPYALAVSNGTVALHLALKALGIGVGDEVIVPDFTFAASINAVLYVGATPVIVDIDPRTWTMDPECVRKAITSRTKAIMPVHLYGHPCHMEELCQIAKSAGVFLVEDCAESLGTLYKGQQTGSFGDASTFSFFGNKTITTGEGGMVVFKEKLHADRAAMLRDHGMSREKRYWHETVGYNYRLTNLQAAIGVAQMERVKDLVEAKRRIAQEYRNGLSDVTGLTLPVEASWAKSTYWLYTVVVDSKAPLQRDELMQKLLLNGVETRPTFYPLHEMPPYQSYAQNNEFPATTYVSRHGMSLPSAVTLESSDVRQISNTLSSLMSVRQNCVTKA